MHKIKYVYLFLFIFLVGCFSKNTQGLFAIDNEAEEILVDTKVLRLDYAIELAKKRNIDLQIAHLKQEIARIDKELAIGNLLPRVDLVAGVAKNDDALHLNLPTTLLGMPQNIALPILDESYYAYSLNAQIPIFVPSFWFLVSARKKGEEVQSLLTSLSEKLVTLEVMNQYYYILALKSEEKIFENEVKAAEELVKQARISLQTDSILSWEYEEAKAYLLSKQVYYQQNLREQKIAAYKLNKSLFLSTDHFFELEKIPHKINTLPSIQECFKQAYQANEKFKIHKKNLEVQADVRNIAISEFLPKIVLGGGILGFNQDLIVEKNTLYGSVLGLLSVFNGFKTVNEYRKALRQEKIAEYELVSEYQSLFIELTNAYNRANTAQEVYTLSKTNLLAVKGKIKQKKAELKHDVIDFREYYTALKEYHEAISFYEKSYYQYQLACGALAIIIGKNPYEWNTNEK